MEKSCKRHSESISPKTIPKSNEEIKELLNCLKADIENYTRSLEVGTDNLVNHFKKSILPLLKKRGLEDSFKDQLAKYDRVLETKTIAIRHNFRTFIEKLASDIKEDMIISSYKNVRGERIGAPLDESIKVVYVDFSNFAMIASQLFFALECYCKILCASSCIRFAISLAQSQVIGHDECWKQLKCTAVKNGKYCGTCLIYDSCNSTVDFEALSRVYAYSMKIRQIADYRPTFVSFDIKKSGLLEYFFTSLLFLLAQRSVIDKCMTCFESTSYNRKEFFENLSKPFIWSDRARLEEMLEKNPDDDFSSYLLGRAYYNENRYEKAVKYLEKAKELNPNNADVWRLLGHLYESMAKTKTDLERAIESHKKANELNPNNFDILMELGVFELAIGKSSLTYLIKASKCARTNIDRCEIFAFLSEGYRIKRQMKKSEYYFEMSEKIFKSITKNIIKSIREYLQGKKDLV